MVSYKPPGKGNRQLEMQKPEQPESASKVSDTITTGTIGVTNDDMILQSTG